MRYLLAIVASCVLSFSFASETTSATAPVKTITPEAMNYVSSLVTLIAEYEKSNGSLPKNKTELLKFQPKISKFNIDNFQTLEFKESDKYRLVVYIETRPDSETFQYKGTINCNSIEDLGTDLKLYGKNPNQQVDPIVTTPVEEVEAQSTQGHP